MGTKSQSWFILLVFLLVAASDAMFPIPQVKAVGTIRILSDGTVNPSGAPITSVDRITYILTANIVDSISIERSNVLIDGAGYHVSGESSGNGFSMIGVKNVTIKKVNIENFIYGIYLESASYINLQENNITANSYDGIGQFYSNHATIKKNNISSNGYDGIEIYNSTGNIISENQIAENKWYGIGIYFSSINTIFANDLENNFNGIELTYSENNVVYHNNFINHTRQVTPVSSVGTWDDGYPSGGNYWADNPNRTDRYKGPKQDQPGGDGICDTPYSIDVDNQDRYPLGNTYEFVLASDINKDNKVNIVDITLVAQAFGSSPGTPNWSPVCDLDHNNVINIIDLTIVSKDFGKTF